MTLRRERATRATWQAALGALCVTALLCALPLLEGPLVGLDIVRYDEGLLCAVREGLARGGVPWLSSTVGNGAPLVAARVQARAELLARGTRAVRRREVPEPLRVVSVGAVVDHARVQRARLPRGLEADPLAAAREPREHRAPHRALRQVGHAVARATPRRPAC